MLSIAGTEGKNFMDPQGISTSNNEGQVSQRTFSLCTYTITQSTSAKEPMVSSGHPNCKGKDWVQRVPGNFSRI